MALATGIEYATASITDVVGKLKVESLPEGNYLTWSTNASVMNTVLLKNGEYLANVNASSSFLDPYPDLTEQHDTYTLEQLVQVSQAETDLDSRVQIDDKAVIADRLPEFLGISNAQASVAPSTTELRYRTFIREPWVKAPYPAVCGNSGYFFLGDNRSYGPSETSFRTSQRVTIDWQNASVTQIPETGHTVRGDVFNGVFTKLDSKHANTDGILLDTGTVTSSVANFRIYESEMNPYCDPNFTNGITYDFNVKVYAAGSYSMSGWLLQVPDHEVYIRNDNSGSWATVFKNSNLTFDCLSKYTASTACLVNKAATGAY